jgi:uncharacterized protein (TIGR02246 family)
MPDPILHVLAAERAVRRLVSLYCDAVRRRDPDAVGVLFTDDARVRIVDMPERVGREAIVEGLRRTMTNFSYLHQMCDVGLIDVDGAVARARLGVFEANRPNGLDSLNTIFGDYDDEYRLVDDGWRFHRRRFSLRFRALAPASAMEHFAEVAPGFTFAP